MGGALGPPPPSRGHHAELLGCFANDIFIAQISTSSDSHPPEAEQRASADAHVHTQTTALRFGDGGADAAAKKSVRAQTNAHAVC